jgi:hypothetical protein
MNADEKQQQRSSSNARQLLRSYGPGPNYQLVND